MRTLESLRRGGPEGRSRRPARGRSAQGRGRWAKAHPTSSAPACRKAAGRSGFHRAAMPAGDAGPRSPEGEGGPEGRCGRTVSVSVSVAVSESVAGPDRDDSETGPPRSPRRARRGDRPPPGPERARWDGRAVLNIVPSALRSSPRCSQCSRGHSPSPALDLRGALRPAGRPPAPVGMAAGRSGFHRAAMPTGDAGPRSPAGEGGPEGR